MYTGVVVVVVWDGRKERLTTDLIVTSRSAECSPRVQYNSRPLDIFQSNPFPPPVAPPIP